MTKYLYRTAFAIMLVFVVVKAENINDKSDNDDDQKNNSLESESVEVYNSSSKEKAERGRDVKSHIKDNDNTSADVHVCNTELPTLNHVENLKTSYPYTVSIQKKGSHYASGALIDKRWILTVAREFYHIRESIKLYRARLGSINCKKSGELVPLKWIEIHPSYVYNEPSFDVAMLRIAKVLEFSESIKPIPLSNVKGRIVNAKFLTTYWPRLIVNGNILPLTASERVKPNSLRVSKQRLLPLDKCYRLSQRQNFTLDVSSLCLEPIISHHSPCMPDTGAPITADDGLWGITSGWTSLECSKHPSPTIFTRISSSHIRSWLESLL